MTTFSNFQREKQHYEWIASALIDVSNLLKDLELEEEANILENYAEQLKQKSFKLVFLGDFARGKKTLVQAILGTKTSLGIHNLCLRVPSILTYGEDCNIVIHSKDGESEVLNQDLFVELFKITPYDIEELHTKGYIERIREIEFVKHRYNNQILRQSVEVFVIPELELSNTSRYVLCSANAIILVLNATQLLAQDETYFIENYLGSGRLENVFFVVNYINRVEDNEGEDGVNEVKEWVYTKLKHHFLNNDGEFDSDFYRRRVFFVNAKGALDARTSEILNNDLLQSSGVPALEKPLEEYLTSPKAIQAFLKPVNHYLCSLASQIHEIMKNSIDESQDIENLKKIADKLQSISNKIFSLSSDSDSSSLFSSLPGDTVMTSQQASTNNTVYSELQQNHNAQGYEGITSKINTIASVLEDSAILVGNKQSNSINLKLGGVFNQPGLNLSNEAEELSKYAHDIRQGIFKVIVLGEFKHGKSTLINSILGSKTLPAKTTPATAIITILVFGDSKDVLVYETNKKTPQKLSWENFKEEFKLTPQDIEVLHDKGFLDRFKDIEYAQIECTHPLCGGGVRLIDSPGLGEQASRTKLSTRYLKQSQAVIFVLTAKQILSEPESKFIENHLGSGRLENVFFVVNYINLVEDDEGKDGVNEVKEWVHTKLKHHFLNNNGEFDSDFYRRRVFFVNAKGALDAKIASPQDTLQLNASGVLALEKELERFLTSDAKDAVALEESLRTLNRMIQISRETIDAEKVTVEKPVALLEKNRILAEEKLKELESKKLKIETTIGRFGEVIGGKVFGNLMLFVNELKDTWDTDSKTLMNIDEVGFWTILKSSASGGAKEKIKTVIEREVNKYLQEKLRQWAEQIPTLIQEDTERMKAELEIKLEDFQKGLAQVNSIFSTGELLGTYELDTEKGKFSKAVQGFMNVLFLDPSGLTGTLIGKGDWGSFFMRHLADFLIFGVVSSIATPIVGLLVYAILELVHMGIQQSSFKDRLLNTIGEKVHATLPTEMAKQQDAIRQRVQQQFNSSARHLTDKLQAEIDQTRTRQNQLIEEMRQKSFSAAQEKIRLDAISSKLVELFYIAGQASGKTSEEVSRLLGDETSFAEIRVND